MKRAILSLLLLLAPADLSAKSAESAALCIGIPSLALMTIGTFTALGLGITASKQNLMCDPNSAYNMTVEQTNTYTCCKCVKSGGKGQCYKEICDQTCSNTIVVCQNSNGIQISATVENNPAYWGFIGGCAAAGGLAFLSFIATLAVGTSLCIAHYHGKVGAD